MGEDEVERRARELIARRTVEAGAREVRVAAWEQKYADFRDDVLRGVAQRTAVPAYVETDDTFVAYVEKNGQIRRVVLVRAWTDELEEDEDGELDAPAVELMTYCVISYLDEAEDRHRSEHVDETYEDARDAAIEGILQGLAELVADEHAIVRKPAAPTTDSTKASSKKPPPPTGCALVFVAIAWGAAATLVLQSVT